MVSSAAVDNNRKLGTSAFSQVPVLNFDKEGNYPMAMDTSTSSNSGIVPSPERVPNYTVHTGANNNNSNNNNNSEKQSLHVRQNFGKDQGYIPPPQTRDNRFVIHTSAPSMDRVHNSEPKPVANKSRKDEMPFDVLNHMIIRDRSLDIKGPSREPVSPPRTLRTTSGAGFAAINELDPDRGRFTLPPLKVSNPSSLLTTNDQQLRKLSSRDQITDIRREMESRQASPPTQYQQQFGLSPASSAVSEEEVNTSQAAVASTENIAPLERPEHVSRDEDDSLFDFAEEVKPQFPEPFRKPVIVTHKIRRRNRTKKTNHDAEDTSIECAPPVKGPSPTTLQERTAAAWRVRRAAKASSLRSKDKPTNKNSNVSFGGSDTVHHFEPVIDSRSETDANDVDDEEATLPSIDGRSLNSEYTKTLESEVEDMIKDILFIGNGKSSVPGRRKLKYKPNIKRKLRKKRQMDVVTDTGNEGTSSLSTNTGSNPASKIQVKVYPDEQDRGIASKSSNVAVRSPKSRDVDSATTTMASSTQDESDPFIAMWGFVEGGVAAMSSALGLDVQEPENEKAPPPKNIIQPTKQNKRRSATGNNCTDLLFGDGTCTGTLSQSSKLNKKNDKMVNYAQELWYSELQGESDSSFDACSSASKSQDEDETENMKRLPFDPESMDRDPRLMHLALQAAKSLHQLQDLQYDESIPVDMVTDVKMSIVELKLPLGLIFLENDGGCFVTKVAPDGSAARSGGVEVGDQLACINGVVSLNMRVGDICKAIPRDPKQKIIELCFLRYVGPMRPTNKNSSWDNYDILEENEMLKDKFEGQEVLARVPKKPEKPSKGKRRFRFFGRGKKRG